MVAAEAVRGWNILKLELRLSITLGLLFAILLPRLFLAISAALAYS